jgi:hypothetical protein
VKKFLKEWDWFSTKDYRHLPVFIGFVALLVGLTVALTFASRSTQGGQSGASGYSCIPLPGCYRNHTCPEILNYRIGNFSWCLPRPTPTCMQRPACLDAIPSCKLAEPAGGWCPTPTTPPGCYYQPVVCPAIACIQGQPCPICPPPKLVCPSPVPTSTPPGGCYYTQVVCPLYCIQGQPCPTCAPKLVCPSPTPIVSPVPQPIACGYPNYACPTGLTCTYCTGAIIPGQPTPQPNTGCACIPGSKASPTPTPSQTTCNTDSDCPTGSTCMTTGPVVANQPVHKICVQQGQAVPL